MNALLEGIGPISSALVTEYEDIFIKVEDWGTFRSSDIRRNGLYLYAPEDPVPDFVTERERELDREPGVAADVCRFLDTLSTLTRQCRRMTFSKELKPKIFIFWRHILDLSRTFSSRASHPNLPPKASLTGLPGVTR